jgi:hypothetical protein
MTNTLALRPGWTPLTIGLMVLGFIVFWPLGFAMLAYILWGDRLHRMANDAGESFRASGWNCSGRSPMRSSGLSATGNVAFDEYRKREIERIEAERRKLDEMRAEFDSYLAELRRAKDKEEFDRFMSDRDRREREGGTA